MCQDFRLVYVSRLQALIFLRNSRILGQRLISFAHGTGFGAFLLAGVGVGGCYKYGRFVNVHVLFDHSSHLGNLLRSFFFMEIYFNFLCIGCL